jgi:hypothetical protein
MNHCQHHNPVFNRLIEDEVLGKAFDPPGTDVGQPWIEKLLGAADARRLGQFLQCFLRRINKANCRRLAVLKQVLRQIGDVIVDGVSSRSRLAPLTCRVPHSLADRVEVSVGHFTGIFRAEAAYQKLLKLLVGTECQMRWSSGIQCIRSDKHLDVFLRAGIAGLGRSSPQLGVDFLRQINQKARHRETLFSHFNLAWQAAQ